MKYNSYKVYVNSWYEIYIYIYIYIYMTYELNILGISCLLGSKNRLGIFNS